MKSLKKTAVLLIVALSLTLMAIGAYFYFFIKMKDLAGQTIELGVKADELAGKESRIRNADTMMRNESVRIEKLSQYLIKESEIVVFTKKIEALAEESGIRLTIESLDSGIGDGGTAMLNFRIKAKGEFKNIIKFTALLENFPAKLEWKNVKLVREEGVTQVVDQKTTINKQSLSANPIWVAEASLSVLNFVKE
ncbi:MAG: hypothetical protein AAB628_03135 [Patescibacteria group bacterium]